MPTFNRRPFVRLSLQRFLDQDYPNKELIVRLDRVGDLLGHVAGVHYVRVASKHLIGSKRNLACSEANGETIVQWDDDDWYAPDRIMRQMEECGLPVDR